MALVNQTQSRQGNANFVLYKLAQKHPSTFHDVTTGTISVPCQSGSPNCTVSHAGDQFGILAGYNARVGYDLATGIGSVDVESLLSNWTSAQFTATTTTLHLNPTSSLTHGQSVAVTGSVVPTSGSGVPTGDISLITSTGLGVDGFRLSGGAISGNTNLLPGGTYTVTAHYGGDPTFGGSDSSPVSIIVGKENSGTQLNLVTFDWNGREVSNNATTAVYGSPYLLRVNVLNSAGAVCSPNPLGESSCPTGTVSLNDNGSALDGGAFKLNSLGYTEDQAIDLSGGSNAVTASYAGDNSFNASSSSATYSVTSAPTTISTPVICCGTVGVGFSTQVTIQAQSFGATPTGTVTFTANGSPISGNVSYQQAPSSGFPPTTSLTAFFSSSNSAFANAGNYSIVASYSGDANYASSTSSGGNVTVKYPSPLLSMNPSSLTVAAGTSVTVSALIDTSMKNVPVPTGTVPFIYWGPMLPVSGTETYTTTADSNGNVELKASITFVPAGNTSITANYNGDSNYPSAGGGGLTDITVTGSDFALIPSLSSVPAAAGESGFLQIYVLGQSNYTGTINLSASSCTGLPKETSCSFDAGSITGAGSTGLTINTTAPHQLASITPAHGLWASSFGMPIAALIFFGFPYRRNLRKLFLSLLLMSLIVSFGCGGGSSSSQPPHPLDPGTPKGSYPITVTATSGSGSTAITHTTTFTLVVQ
jgi:plastocyanin